MASNMSSQSGRTAPRLIRDLYNYDPFRGQSEKDFLTGLPAKSPDGNARVLRSTPGPCRHRYVIKMSQCRHPPEGLRPQKDDSFKTAAICQECRCHLDMTINFRMGNGDQICPNEDFPLHHFLLVSTSAVEETAGTEEEGVIPWDQPVYRFTCSSPTCSATVGVQVRPPRLQGEKLALLLDRDRIRKRVQPLIDSDPVRFKGVPVAEPIRLLGNLRKYLSDALQTNEKRRVNTQNKAFVSSLGAESQPLLEYLGFSYEEEIVNNEKQSFWVLPQVQDVAGYYPRYTSDLGILLDDVDLELIILMDKRDAAEKQRAGKAGLAVYPDPASRFLELCLGCLNYDKTIASRRLIEVDENPHYSTLGAVADFSDDLVIFAYERQRSCDRINAPLYFDCLQTIAKERNSDTLQTKLVLMESVGEVSSTGLKKAYNYFGLDINQPGLEEDNIIGIFQSRLVDAPRQEAEAREQLRIIGVARGSSRIESVASNRITTYEQALSWLGAEERTNDEFIISLLAYKLGEVRGDQQVARTAASLIAEKRDSMALRNWLANDAGTASAMDVGDAYRRLGIDDRTLDEETILTTFEIRYAEDPAHLESLRAALKVIGEERGSQRIQGYLNNGAEPPPVNYEWPVGLENIGNTCYLNSLLQFYFSVKPLRQLVLGFENFEQDLGPDSVAKKRVGSRRVTLKEIERAKKFAYELRDLFQTLINAQASSISPNLELARLILIKASDEDNYRRLSITGPRSPFSLGNINGVPIIGPVGPPPTQMDMDLTSDGPGVPSDVSSNGTLVDRSQPIEDDVHMSSAETQPNGYSNDIDVDPEQRKKQGMVFEDKENHPPMNAPGNSHGSSKDHAHALEETGPSKINEQGPRTTPTDELEELDVAGSSAVTNGPSLDGRPPVPPRPKAAETVRVNELELGAQQDVTEVIGNVLFQLECALRPLDIDDSGEQIDEIKKLFYGRVKTHIEAANGHRENSEYFADIKIDVSSGPRDIYAALDGAFDVQNVKLEDGTALQYTAISQAPSILQLHVQRVQFDKEKGKMYKSDSHLKLREVLYLDRYLDTDDAVLLSKRREAWQWKEKREKLIARRNALAKSDIASMSVAETLTATSRWLSSAAESGGMDEEEADELCLDNAAAEVLTSSAFDAEFECEEISSAIMDLDRDIEAQFADLTSLPYRLQSVFIHRGTATFGHYWIYIFDFERHVWRKYNDGYVTEVTDTSEIFDQDPQYPATPYYLVYVRDDLKDVLVDPVCRVRTAEAEAEQMEEVQEMVSVTNGTTVRAQDTWQSTGGPAAADVEDPMDDSWE